MSLLCFLTSTLNVHVHLNVYNKIMYMSLLCFLMFLYSTFPPSSDTLVRVGFSSLQLIVTDFLPILSNLCLPVCIEVVGRYGLQDQDLNISLTSIGLLVIYMYM